MKYKIVFTKLARITNEYNLSFLNKFSHSYASKMRYYIIQNIEALKSFPNAFSIYIKNQDHIFRKLTINHLYHIIYTVSNNKVIILYITDARKASDNYLSYLK